MFRLAFDPLLPVFATSDFSDGTVKAGEAFDWRTRGLQAIDALAMFRSGLLTHAASHVIAVHVTPGERVVVETPAQQRKRKR